MSNFEPRAVPPAESAPPPWSAAVEQSGKALPEPVLPPAEQSTARSADTPPLFAAGQAPNASPASAIAPDQSAQAGSGSPPPAPVETLNAQKPRGRPFQPGQSGNPLGKPKGSRNWVTRALEALIDDQGEALIARAVQKALDGDSPMLRALLNRLVPRRTDRTVEFAIPEIKTAADAHSASSAILAACSHGELSPSEAAEVMALISMHVNTIKAAEYEERLCALEGKKMP
jgi:hypothetical protein